PEAEEGARLLSSSEVKILVLDDDASIGRLIQAALAGHGFLLDAVSEPSLMEAQLKKQQYQLIILDYVLPGLDSQKVMEWIRERRKALGLTLADMGKRTGVSLGYLSQIELGKNSASVETLYRIALGLRIRIADLFQAVQTSE